MFVLHDNCARQQDNDGSKVRECIDKRRLTHEKTIIKTSIMIKPTFFIFILWEAMLVNRFHFIISVEHSNEQPVLNNSCNVEK